MTRPTATARVLDAIVSYVARLLKVPPLALRMFRAANDMSGLDRKTLPTELIPLNTIQLSRGLLNFTALQALPGWVFPYWAVRQFDPGDPGFIPRSHLGLSINLTHRNWTAVGAPDCPFEPVVDQAGAVTPFRNRWSIDVWLRTETSVLFPSLAAKREQSLLEDLPIAITTFQDGGITLTLTSFTHDGILTHTAAARNGHSAPRTGALAIAVRPFNPEGVALTHDLRYDPRANRIVIDESESLYLSKPPAGVLCSNRAGGDTAVIFGRGGNGEGNARAHCTSGLANAHALFPFILQPGEEFSVTARVPLDGSADLSGLPRAVGSVRDKWNRLLATGVQVETPDTHLNSLLRASVATVLQLTDGETITPGPWTYHQFWFRDAAAMLRALDAFGFHRYARPVIDRFRSYQERDGFFRSQQGEWDSNGQALWTVWQHALLSHDGSVVREMFKELSRGVEWIRAKRLAGPEHKGKTYEGLLPAGLSAEHLGLADYYYWDNWWAMAGIRAYARLCAMVGERERERNALALLKEYGGTMDRSIAATMNGNAAAPIPAGPGRVVDCGMIGTCAAWYPLQVLPVDDPRMRASLEALTGKFLVGGLFYQDFIHSGMNAYLTLHLAQAWLHGGEREKFWQLLTSVARRATATMNFPEAIHPRTGGGAMGDGHHGWAAAEFCLAMRNAFVREVWTNGEPRPTLVLLSGIPSAWAEPGSRCAITEAPVPGGRISIESVRRGDALTVTILAAPREEGGSLRISVRLPLVAGTVRVNGGAAGGVRINQSETWIDCGECAGRVVVACECGPEGGYYESSSPDVIS
jgi:hypothetical protein